MNNSNATEILPGLWIGNSLAVSDPIFLKNKQIQCIIDCSDESETNEIIIRLKEYISSYNILIHNRKSPDVMIAYLVKYGKMDQQSALIALKSKKPDLFN
jgi:hypothetical protein